MLALILGRLAARCGLPAVVGELCVGIVLGPSLLDHVAPDIAGWLLPKDTGQFHLLDAAGQLGVLLLVGITGVELDLGMVRRRGRTTLAISLSGLLLPLGLGIGAGYLVPEQFLGGDGERPVFALFLGVAMCVSAIPVITKTLSDMNLLHRNVGQLTLAAGMIDDIVGWLMLSIVSAMATTGVHPQTVGRSIMWIAVVIGFAATVGRVVTRIGLRRANRAAAAGAPAAFIAVIVLLASAATQSMGLEAVFGAFVAGIMLRQSGAVRMELLAPIRTFVLAVLAPLFFATAGLRADLTALRRPEVLLLAVTVLFIAVVGKFVGAFLGARLGRLDRWEALAIGAGMNSRGVIELVVASVGLRLGVLTTESYTVVVLVAVATSVMAPPILRFATRRIEQTTEEVVRARLSAAGVSG
ncbi:cation:proton antiporter [Streptomyces sp. MZ04]|nr:cation:proton antiporter [Streptomyces sp. MZ04]